MRGLHLTIQLSSRTHVGECLLIFTTVSRHRFWHISRFSTSAHFFFDAAAAACASAVGARETGQLARSRAVIALNDRAFYALRTRADSPLVVAR